VWSNSHYYKKVDTALSECLRLISECIKSTSMELLLILCGIEPADIQRDKNILKLWERAMSETHYPLLSYTTGKCQT